jgi:Cu/Ag efflux protein CusF
MLRIMTAAFAAPLGLLSFGANAQQQSGLMSELDRAHTQIDHEKHVYSLGTVESVDIGQGTMTIWHAELESPDKSIWMPTMRMTFHVTSKRMLKGLKPGDRIGFEAVRMRNAVLVTKIRLQ